MAFEPTQQSKQTSSFIPDDEIQIKKKKGLLTRASDLAESTFGRAGEALFGTTGRQVGRLVSTIKENVQELGGKEITDRKGFSILPSDEAKAPSAKEIAFTALETTPAGQFTKIPGVKQASSFVAKQTAKLPGLLRGRASEQITKALAPTKIETKATTQKIASEVSERGILSFTRQGLLNKAQTAIIKVGDKFDEVLASIPKTKTVNVKPIVDSLEASKRQFKVLEKGKEIIVEPEAIKRIDEVKDILSQFGNKVSFESLRGLRQIWDRTVAQSKGFVKTVDEGTKLDIKKRATNAIRKELAEASPDLAKLNAEFTFWKRLENVVGETIKRTQPQKGATEKVAQSVGFIAGFSKAGLAVPILVGEAARSLVRLTSTTAWRTVSASLKVKLAKAIESGNTKNITEIIKRIAIIIENQ